MKKTTTSTPMPAPMVRIKQNLQCVVIVRRAKVMPRDLRKFPRVLRVALEPAARMVRAALTKWCVESHLRRYLLNLMVPEVGGEPPSPARAHNWIAAKIDEARDVAKFAVPLHGSHLGATGSARIEAFGDVVQVRFDEPGFR